MYTIAHLLGISNGKHLRRSSWVINLKHHTFMSLAVEPMCFFPVKFMLTNLHYILNWWYSLGIRTMVITLCTYTRKYHFYSTYAIFDKEIFPKCTDSHMKEYKLYDKLLNKISPETESSVPDTSGKDGPASVSRSLMVDFILFSLFISILLFIPFSFSFFYC